MRTDERNYIRKRLVALEVERTRYDALINEIREMLDIDEERQKAKHNNTRNAVDGRFIKNG